MIYDTTDYGCQNAEKARTELETSFLLGSIECSQCWAFGNKRASSSLAVLGVTSYPFIGS